jgi:hypothetical protein
MDFGDKENRKYQRFIALDWNKLWNNKDTQLEEKIW